MFPKIGTLKQPLAIRPEHVVDRSTTLHMQQRGHSSGVAHGTKFTIHDASSNEALDQKAHVAEKEQSSVLISVDAKNVSLDARHTFRDATRLPLFELYRPKIGVTWYVEVPGGNGTPIAVFKPRFSVFKDNMDLELKNAAANGEDVRLHIQGQDVWKQRINVSLGDEIVMTIKRNEKLSVYVPGKKLSWSVDVAAGIDISLASAIVVVLSATMYNSSMTASSS
ncbi:hypothetical protein NQ176_g7297 [Zarea fungicola]|uniref:Uncharacterized protein n=1 Tax=Zarea fungicola TaxID=93591 RepID=A0ACC1MZL3_9HYPO|nr:hypothetical protein NQ176_g7297 [Lecanicillium fungicola]